MKWLDISIFLALLLFAEARNEDDGRIVAAYSTKTAYSITTSTTTIPLTCATGGGPNVCKKRRYRRYSALDVLPVPAEDENVELGGTLTEDSDVLKRLTRDVPTQEDSEREGRIAITIWTTKSSTYTVTSTSVNSQTTFSISYYCTALGAPMAPACG